MDTVFLHTEEQTPSTTIIPAGRLLIDEKGNLVGYSPESGNIERLSLKSGKKQLNNQTYARNKMLLNTSHSPLIFLVEKSQSDEVFFEIQTGKSTTRYKFSLDFRDKISNALNVFVKKMKKSKDLLKNQFDIDDVIRRFIGWNPVIIDNNGKLTIFRVETSSYQIEKDPYLWLKQYEIKLDPVKN